MLKKGKEQLADWKHIVVIISIYQSVKEQTESFLHATREYKKEVGLA